MFRKLVLFLQSTFGLTDWLTFVRHVIISIYSWILSPMLFQRVDETTARIVMFVFSLMLVVIFLKIAEVKTEKSKLISLVERVFKKRRALVVISLFFIEPFLFTVYYRNYYYHCDSTVNKIKFYLILTMSSLTASSIWATFIYFSGLRI